MTAVLSGRRLWRSWLVWATVGEAAGFCVPAVVAVLTLHSPTTVTVPSLLLAGATEGALLGAGQAHVLRRTLPQFPARRWVLATSAGAVVAWSLGVLPSTVGDNISGWPVAIRVIAAALGGSVLLLSIGTAQWTVLRRHVRRAGRWIGVTATAWLAGLAAFMLLATPLWHEGQAAATVAAIGVGAGLVMAGTVAAVTGLGLVRLVAASSPAPAAATVAARHELHA